MNTDEKTQMASNASLENLDNNKIKKTESESMDLDVSWAKQKTDHKPK